MTKVNVDEVVIDGQTYVPKEFGITKGDIRIVILQRGWIMVGRLLRNWSECVLSNASVIRIWGTTKGLGELAKNGPLDATKLDKTYGNVEFDYLTAVATIVCEEKVWKNVL